MAGGRRIGVYAAMLRSWLRQLAGRSYWHQPLPLGRHFVPGALEGYFLDLSGKAAWTGDVDAAGLPLVRTSDGRLALFATTVLQKGLGHWDVWLAGGRKDDGHRDAFLNIARWALAAQDSHGGWPLWAALGLKYASEYSAMVQGEGVSVLLRAGECTGGDEFRAAAERAVGPLLAPVSEGGCSRRTPEGLVLEETPRDIPNTILNGWVFALYGLYDLGLVRPVPQAQEALASTLAALAACLPRYDAGYWSYYDTAGNLASPFYHQLHIGQLQALEKTFPQHAAFRQMRAAFERQWASRLNHVRAVCRKAAQKLARPPEVVVK